jgi:hypothetical protein
VQHSLRSLCMLTVVSREMTSFVVINLILAINLDLTSDLKLGYA